MDNSSYVPGDSQSPEFVDSWVNRNVTERTAMVARQLRPGGYEFTLVEVELNSTDHAILTSQHFGLFETTGLRQGAAHDSVRLCVPTPEMVQWAVGDLVWKSGRSKAYTRKQLPRANEAFKNLLEHLKFGPWVTG